MRTDNALRIGLTICLGLVVLLLPEVLTAQTGLPPGDSASQRNKVWVEAGYFSPLPDGFRTFYGSGFGFGLAFEHRISAKWGFGVRSEYEALSKLSPDMEYRHVSACPMIIFTAFERDLLRLTVGGGMGMDFRRVRLKWNFTDLEGEVYDTRWLNDDETSAMILLHGGIDVLNLRPLSFGLNAYYDRHLLSNGSRGAFGDTGGLHIMGSLGFWM